MRLRNTIIFALLAMLTYTSCGENTITETETIIDTVIIRDTIIYQEPDPYENFTTTGFYLLSEGTYGAGDSQLSYYDLSNSDNPLTMDYLGSKNSGAKLGDTAQDVIVYGGKSYVIVNNSNKVVILNAHNGVMEKELELKKDDVGVSPRYAVGAEGKVFISTWHDGVMVLDTTTLTLDSSIALSQAFSEGIAYVDGNLYVANSGIAGEPYGGNGNTISIVSVEEKREIGTIEVPKNPNILKVADNGDMYLSTWGDYYSTEALLHKIDYKNKTVEKTWSDFSASKFAITDKYIYTYNFSYIVYEMVYKRIHRDCGLYEDYDIQSEALRSVYGVSSDPITNDIFITCESGAVVWYNEEGEVKREFTITIPEVHGVRTNRVVPVTFEKR